MKIYLFSALALAWIAVQLRLFSKRTPFSWAKTTRGISRRSGRKRCIDRFWLQVSATGRKGQIKWMGGCARSGQAAAKRRSGLFRWLIQKVSLAVLGDIFF